MGIYNRLPFKLGDPSRIPVSWAIRIFLGLPQKNCGFRDVALRFGRRVYLKVTRSKGGITHWKSRLGVPEGFHPESPIPLN